MFQKGDEVVVKMPGDQVDGLKGYVKAYEPGKLWPVIVEFDYFGIPKFNWAFDEVELILIEEDNND